MRLSTIGTPGWMGLVFRDGCFLKLQKDVLFEPVETLVGPSPGISSMRGGTLAFDMG
jgi:hypothetical protein